MGTRQWQLHKLIEGTDVQRQSNVKTIKRIINLNGHSRKIGTFSLKANLDIYFLTLKNLDSVNKNHDFYF